MHTAGKFALVTGAARGIGRAIVVKLLENGAAGVCLVDIDRTLLPATTDQLKAAFPELSICYFIADVSDKDQLERAFAFAKESLGKLHIVANNAGVYNDDSPELMAAVNLVAVHRGTLLALQHMGRDCGGEGGVIINTASIAGLIIWRNSPFYTATKHGVVALTRSAGTEEYLLRTGVRVNCLCPGPVDTDMLKAFVQGIQENIEVMKLRSQIIPPEAVADAFLKLVNDKEANGKALTITGPEDCHYFEFQKDLFQY